MQVRVGECSTWGTYYLKERKAATADRRLS